MKEYCCCYRENKNATRARKKLPWKWTNLQKWMSAKFWTEMKATCIQNYEKTSRFVRRRFFAWNVTWNSLVRQWNFLQNSIKEQKCRLPFPNICIGSRDICVWKMCNWDDWWVHTLSNIIWSIPIELSWPICITEHWNLVG